MKKEYQVTLLVPYGMNTAQDFMLFYAEDCIKLDETSILIDGLQITFNESEIDSIKLTGN